MHLSAVTIRNFRLLQDIDVSFDNKVNVIVGPNASGKTTILDAIRFAKAMLAPRTSNEANQVLFALGAGSPQMPGTLISDALAQDPTAPVTIKTRYALGEDELAVLKSSVSQLAGNLVISRFGQPFGNRDAVIAYMSSPDGVKALAQADGEIKAALHKVEGSKSCSLELIIDLQSGNIRAGDPLAPLFVSLIESRLPPSQTMFAYFPADRALPLGEIPIQLGAADSAQQLESYNSQPQLKYQRLKNTIFGSVIVSEMARKELEDDFKNIFENVLKGRRLAGFNVNQVGMFSIRVQDVGTSRTFDLDGMSSGEKGLILTCLLIARTASKNSVVLLDEPELHLNPAICKGLLTFFVDTYAKKKNIQLITCTHSPEVLMGAFEREECSVFHLESPIRLTKARRKDETIISEALRRLGTSEVDALLFKSTIFVEGDDDEEILQAGFGDLLRGYKLHDRGGRSEVEKLIRAIQEAEARGVGEAVRYFIFDRDRKPTDLESSKSAKILQWKRYCIENYLIEVDILTDLLTNGEVNNDPLASESDTIALLKSLAMAQLDGFVARQVYEGLALGSIALARSDVEDKSALEIADALVAKAAALSTQIQGLTATGWRGKFVADCATRRSELLETWEANWRDSCDGKRLFRGIQKRTKLNMGLRQFKRRIMQEMRLNEAPGWKDMEGLLKNMLAQ